MQRTGHLRHISARMTAGTFLLAASLAAGPARVADAADLRGPAFGKNKYNAAITDAGGVADVDDFVAALVQGETLTVTVTSAKGSALFPALILVKPDGTEVAPTVKESKGGKKVQLKGFAVDASGVWAVRVVSKDGSQGGYSVAFSIKAAKPLKATKQALGGANPMTAFHDFGGIDGAVLDLTLSWDKKGSAVDLASLKDPQGADVAGAGGADAADQEVPKGPAGSQLLGVVLGDGDGTYRAGVSIPEGTATYTIGIKVTPQGRPSSKNPTSLGATDPFLVGRATPLRGAAGRGVRLNGGGFSANPVPAVYFDGVRATGVSVGLAGDFVDVVAPAGTDGALVDVVVQNPDGQATRRAGYFQYAPAAAVTDLTDLVGSQVRSGPTAGGTALRIVGTNLLDTASVLVGPTRTSAIRNVTATQVEFDLPAGVGNAGISVRDVFGRDAAAPFQLAYKAPPTFAANAFNPAVSPPGGGTQVTLTGTNFAADDVFTIDGDVVATTFVGATSRTFSAPDKAPGSYATRLRDRFGAIADGPSFVIKGPPTVTSVTPVAGSFVGTEIPVAGGTTVRVAGTNFRSDDTVTLGGNPATLTPVSATQFDFTAPAGDFGAADLIVADAFGQSVTVVGALSYAGFADSTADRSPGRSDEDDLSAFRGAIGDLDRDGVQDDLVLTTRYGASYDPDTGQYTYYGDPGSRYEYTRLFVGDSGALTDMTSNLPTYKEFGENFDGTVVALGDLDGNEGDEIVTTGGYAYFYDPNLGYGRNVLLTVFANDGYGGFKLDLASCPNAYASDVVTAYDNKAGQEFLVFYSYGPSGPGNSIALGDLDRDGDDDVVVGNVQYRIGQVYLPPQYVDFSVPGAYTADGQSGYYPKYGSYSYAPSVGIFDNRINEGAGLSDVSFPRLPLSGDRKNQLPAFPSRHLALGDLDGDEDLDIVGSFTDPTQMTPYGIFYGPGYSPAQEATWVLLNDGKGFFQDGTASWIPAGSGSEFWQADRIALTDLDGDKDPDLVLLLADPLDAWAGGASTTDRSLRILRNDGDGTGFTDVTDSALPGVPLAGTADDTMRGTALAVRDVNGDGVLDILIGTKEALVDGAGNRVRSTRLLLGTDAFAFLDGSGFLPPPTDDSGESTDILFGDFGAETPSVLLLTNEAPETSPNGELLRILDWRR